MEPAEQSDLSQKDQQFQAIEVEEFSSEIYPDRRRVMVTFQLSAFQVNPNASIKLLNQNGDRLAEVNIINIFSQANEITLHIPVNQNKPGDYKIELDLFYIQEEGIPGADDQVSLKTIPLKSITTSFTLL
jgi:predicted SnoaL-like aldol condensation-catalyzing enzyme